MIDIVAEVPRAKGALPASKRIVPLIPAVSVAGRALVVVVAIMTFLACLTAGAALLVTKASQEWRLDVLREVTIQVKPLANVDVETIVTKAVKVASRAPGVANARPYSETDSERLLEPWLGAGIDLSLLPVPRIIVVQMKESSAENLAGLREALARDVPEASLDDNRVWATRLGVMARAIVALAVSLFALVILALATAIGFATRGAMAGSKDIVEILHLVGASDAFIAKEFQTHFRRLGLRGAAIGVSAGFAFFLAASALSAWWAHSPGGDEIAAMFGAFSLDGAGYVALAAVGAAVSLLTGYLSRSIVLKDLQKLQ